MRALDVYPIRPPAGGAAAAADWHAAAPEFQALLRRCRAYPDDRVGHLVLADWLDECGAPAAAAHAAVVRWQCEPGAAGRTRLRRGASHFADLAFAVPPARWGGGPAERVALVNTSGVGVYYRYGLPVAVKCGLEDWVRYGPILGGVWGVPEAFVPVPSGSRFGAWRDDRHDSVTPTWWVQFRGPGGLSVACHRGVIPADRSDQSWLVEQACALRGRDLWPDTVVHAAHRFWWGSCRPNGFHGVGFRRVGKKTPAAG